MKISLVAIVLSILVIVGSISIESRYEPRLKICEAFKEQSNCQKSGFLFLWHNSCSYKCSNQGHMFLNCSKVFGVNINNPNCADIQCVRVNAEDGSTSTIQPLSEITMPSTSMSPSLPSGIGISSSSSETPTSSSLSPSSSTTIENN